MGKYRILDENMWGLKGLKVETIIELNAVDLGQVLISQTVGDRTFTCFECISIPSIYTLCVLFTSLVLNPLVVLNVAIALI